MHNSLRIGILVPAVLALLAAVGCTTTTIIARNTNVAIEATVNQARFDLECQHIETTVQSAKVIEDAPSDGTEHTIMARGCGRQLVYSTSCRDGGDCNVVRKPNQVEEFAPEVLP